MIVFSRPPGRKRRAGDVWTSSSGADARRRPRKATLLTALQALTLSSRGPCDGPASRRTTLLAEQPARPPDVSPFYESKYLARAVAEGLLPPTSRPRSIFPGFQGVGLHNRVQTKDLGRRRRTFYCLASHPRRV